MSENNKLRNWYSKNNIKYGTYDRLGNTNGYRFAQLDTYLSGTLKHRNKKYETRKTSAEEIEPKIKQIISSNFCFSSNAPTEKDFQFTPSEINRMRTNFRNKLYELGKQLTQNQLKIYKNS